MRLLTSRQNPRVKLALQLRTKKKRDARGLFLIEGEHELERAVEAGLCFEFVLIGNNQSREPSSLELIERIVSEMGPELVYVDESIMRLVCYRATSSSMVAIAQQFPLALNRISLSKNGLALIAVGLEKPGNLGSILRSADATGTDAVVVCDQVTDVFNPNVVRSSLGTLFSVPVAVAQRDEVIFWAEQNGIRLIASSPHAPKSYYRIDFTVPSAIVVGSESKGLENDWFSNANEVVNLPQLGKADSLNAAMTATVMLFEARRQRDAAICNN